MNMENMNKCSFVITKDEHAKEMLMQNGLTLVSSLNGLHTFVNEPKKFARFEYDKLDITFTNKLYF